MDVLMQFDSLDIFLAGEKLKVYEKQAEERIKICL